MTVYESDVPGVGRKFELDVDDGDGARVVVLLHHDGRVEVFERPGPEADSEKLLDLTRRQANRLGSILEGAYFETVDTNDLSVPLGDAIIEWVDIDADSPLVGRTLRSCDVRGRTGASVVAIQRGEETVANPQPDETLRAGDILVTLGTRVEQTALAAYVRPNRDEDANTDTNTDTNP
jgi:TrkA domain protein